MGVEPERESREKRVAAWLAPEKWKTPSWYGGDRVPDRSQDFESFFTHQLRTRYVELEGDFRSVVGNFPPVDVNTAEAIFGLLQAVRPALEAKHPSLLSITSTLDLIERYMVWLYPPHVFEARLVSTTVRLKELRPPGWSRYLDLLRGGSDTRYLRAPLDEAIGACNRKALSLQIGNGLQIRRLRSFRLWGLLILVVLVAAAPLLLDPNQAPAFGGRLELDIGILEVWLPTVAMLLVGTLGGYLSGLLQARSTRVSLADYEEGMLKLSLRPLVGGLAALLLFILLSWQVFPAIDTKSAGSYVLAGLLAGFSERYFLRLLDVSTETSGSTSSETAESSPTPSPVEIAGSLPMVGWSQGPDLPAGPPDASVP